MPGIFSRPTTLPEYILGQEEFPSCCGIDVITDFDMDPSPLRKDNIDRDIERKLSKDCNHFGDNGPDGANSVMLITLNDIQKKHYDKILKKHGFRVLMADCYHPGHGSYITIYGWRKYKEGDRLPKAIDPEIYEDYR